MNGLFSSLPLSKVNQRLKFLSAFGFGCWISRHRFLSSKCINKSVCNSLIVFTYWLGKTQLFSLSSLARKDVCYNIYLLVQVTKFKKYKSWHPQTPVIVLSCPLIGCWATEKAYLRTSQNWVSRDLYFLIFFTCTNLLIYAVLQIIFYLFFN